MKKKNLLLFILFYTLTVVSFFIPFIKIDLTDYEGSIKVMMGYDNLYFYINLIIVICFNVILKKKKSFRTFTLTIVCLFIILALDIIPIVIHPFTFGKYSFQVGFHLHYFSISMIVYLIYKSVLVPTRKN
ncbi:MAG: hypothetical protein FGM14_15735 [Flavobacteriales bacterium]|nr:hypothetical protein [Flavobacteriales bacterium]